MDSKIFKEMRKTMNDSGFWTDIFPNYLAGVGTVATVVVALWQTKRANDAKNKAAKEQKRVEKKRKEKTLQLIDSLSNYERCQVREANSKILTYKLGRVKFPNNNIENWDAMTRAIYDTYSDASAYHEAHGFSRAFGRPITTSESRLNNVKNLFENHNNQSDIYNILVNYRSVLSNNLSSYHTLLDEKSIEKNFN